MNHFTGLMAAPFTPFDAQGRLNLAIIPAYVEKLIGDGVVGIFVCGSNGEGPNMTIEERMLVAEAFTKAAASRLKVFVHVGHSSIAESQKLAAHAVTIGADAFSSVSAFYFKPKSAEELVNAMSDIASAAPEIPFYYYHIPHLTNVSLDMRAYLELARHRIPNMAGIKYSAPTLWEYQLCRDYNNGAFDILYGVDEMLLPALAAGARGLIGSTYNFAAPLYGGVIESFEKSNLEEARKKMSYLVHAVSVIIKYPAIAAQKAVMKRLGLDLGPGRLPLANLAPSEESQLLKELDQLKFFEKLLTHPLQANGK